MSYPSDERDKQEVWYGSSVGDDDDGLRKRKDSQGHSKLNSVKASEG